MFSGLAKLIFTTYDNLNDLLKPQRDSPTENEINVDKGATTKYKVSDNGHSVEHRELVEVTTDKDAGTSVKF